MSVKNWGTPLTLTDLPTVASAPSEVEHFYPQDQLIHDSRVFTAQGQGALKSILGESEGGVLRGLEITQGSGLTLHIAPGAAIARHSTRGACFLENDTAQNLELEADSVLSIFAYATLEGTPLRDSRENGLAGFAQSAVDVLDGGVLLATVETDEDGIVSIDTSVRQVLALPGVTPATATALGTVKLSIAPVDAGNPIALGANDNLPVSQVSGFVEALQDAVAAFFVAGSGISFTYNDAANTFTVTNSAPLDTEAVQDVVGAMVAAGANVTASYDDAAGTLTIASTGGGSGMTTEQVQDIVAGLLQAGTNVTLNYDDAANTLTVTAAGGSSDAATLQGYDSAWHRDRGNHTGTQTISTLTGLTVGPGLSATTGTGTLKLAQRIVADAAALKAIPSKSGGVAIIPQGTVIEMANGTPYVWNETGTYNAADTDYNIHPSDRANSEAGIWNVNGIGPILNAVPGAVPVMGGATSTVAGTSGKVPAPAAGDQAKFLRADATWATPAGGSGGGNSALSIDASSLTSPYTLSSTERAANTLIFTGTRSTALTVNPGAAGTWAFQNLTSQSLSLARLDGMVKQTIPKNKARVWSVSGTRSWAGQLAALEGKPGTSAYLDTSNSLNTGCLLCLLFNEGGGTSVKNIGSLGTAYNGTVASTSLWSTDGDGEPCLDFTGYTTGPGVSIPSFGSVSPTSEITAVFGMRHTPTTIGGAPLIHCNNSDGTNRISIAPVWSDSTFYWDFGNLSSGGRLGFVPSPAIINAWHNIAVTSSATGNAMLVFSDAVQIGSKSGYSSFTQLNQPLYLGASNSGVPVNAKLTNLRIYNRALTSVEIASLNADPYAGILS